MRIAGVLMIAVGTLMMMGGLVLDGYDAGGVSLAALAGRQAALTAGGFVFVGGWVALGSAAIRLAIKETGTR